MIRIAMFPRIAMTVLTVRMYAKENQERNIKRRTFSNLGTSSNARRLMYPCWLITMETATTAMMNLIFVVGRVQDQRALQKICSYCSSSRSF